MSLDKVIIISFILLFGVNKAFSQEVDKWRKIEVDVSISPNTTELDKSGEIISGDIAVRYLWKPNFYVGLGTVPTYLNFYNSSYVYSPFYLSLRYELESDKLLFPYFLINLGGSFFQFNDLQFQGKVALGAEISSSKRCGIFAEIGLAYTSSYIFWSPISIGLRF